MRLRMGPAVVLPRLKSTGVRPQYESCAGAEPLDMARWCHSRRSPARPAGPGYPAEFPDLPVLMVGAYLEDVRDVAETLGQDRTGVAAKTGRRRGRSRETVAGSALSPPEALIAIGRSAGRVGSA